MRGRTELKTMFGAARARSLFPLFVLLTLTLMMMLMMTVAWAQPDVATPRLIVKPLEPQPVGARTDVEVTLLGIEDRPLDNNVLELYLDGEYLRRIRTGEDGTASLRVSRALPVGSYLATVKFIGTQDYAAQEVSLPVVVRPTVVSVQTVPPLPGIPFALGEERFVSDANGLARIELTEPGAYELEVLVEPETLLTPDTKISFARWSDATFTPNRAVELTNKDLALQVGFELSHPIPITFADLAGAPVDWSRVSSVTLKSSAAAYRTVTDEQPYWLQANRIMRQQADIFPTPLLWSVESVMLDGSNVVNRYQQRFHVAPGDTWELELLLYQANIQARDALFGLPVGKGVDIVYPDGAQEARSFNDDNELSMANLARGLYQVQVTGVRGVAPVTPVAMTRDQEVELKVLTDWNIGILVAVGLLLSFGLLFYGRPYLIGLRAKPALAPAPASLGTSASATVPGTAAGTAAGVAARGAGSKRGSKSVVPKQLEPKQLEDIPEWTAAPKTHVVLSYLLGEASIQELAERYKLAPTLINDWIAVFLEAGEARLQKEGDGTRESLNVVREGSSVDTERSIHDEKTRLN